VFPESIEGTLFSFDSTYTQQEELEFGRGYWLRFISSENVLLSGLVINDWIIDVNEGWNLIGSVSTMVDANYFTTENSLIVPGTIFEFTGSYEIAESIHPGRSYWLRTFEEGVIILSSQNQ
jgi:hypothetical protein